MYIDVEFVRGALILGMVNLIVTVAVASGVIRALLLQRALERAWRLRLAHWRQRVEAAVE